MAQKRSAKRHEEHELAATQITPAPSKAFRQDGCLTFSAVR